MTQDLTRRSVLSGATALSLIGAAGIRPAVAATSNDITVVHNIEPRSLAAPFGGGATVAEHSAKVLDSMFFNTGEQIEPRLATDWRSNAEGTEFTFVLRDGVTWHDGTPFTSADIAFTAMEVWKPMSGNIAYRRIQSVDTPDAVTAVFRMTEPVSPEFMINSVSSMFGMILPKHLYEGTDFRQNPTNKAPVGTGPFRFKEWKAGQYIIYEKNPDYYLQGYPRADRLIYRFERSDANVSAVLESGGADLSVRNSVPLRDITRLRSVPELIVTDKGNEAIGGFLHMELNTRREAAAKPEVRQAIAHAIDIQSLIDIVFLGYATPVIGPLPVNSPYRKAGLRGYNFDPVRAEAMLDAAGYPRGDDGTRLTLDFICATWYASTRQAGEVIRQQLEDVGIKVNFHTPDFGGMVTRVYRDYDYDLALSNSMHFIDPGLTTFDWYWSKAAIPGVPFRNTMGYASPEMDAAIETALSAQDPDTRAAAIDTFQDIALRDLVLLPLVETTQFTVYNSRLENVADNPQWSITSWASLNKVG